MRQHRSAFSVLLLALSMMALLSEGAGSAIAQPTVTSITRSKFDPSSQPSGRDFWFAMAKNYDDQPGKYYKIYVSSTRSTMVHVQLTNAANFSLPVLANKVSTFDIPLSWEVKTSGIVEDKVIHVWSDDADLSVYLMSHNPYSSDGTQIFPTIALGNDYVVAAYGSPFDKGSSFDYPSEFVVMAHQDNCHVKITPSADIRVTGQGTKTLHPAGKEFEEILNRGQVVQYMATTASDADSFDLTGTVIHSDKPVGVIGASQSTQIPAGYQSFDYVCEMIPSKRTWGTRYYTAPFVSRTGGDTFLAIASVDNQQIFTEDVAHGKRLFAVLKKDDYLFKTGIDTATVWTSDWPFLLMQYQNSSSYPNGGTIGDPAMMNVPSVEGYQRTAIFQTPSGISNPYSNYIDVVVKDADLNTAMLDGALLKTGATVMQVDGLYDVVRRGPITLGAHSISSNSGVGVMVYGDGNYESYAWSATSSAFAANSVDTVAPIANTLASSCTTLNLQVADTGSYASAISLVWMDTAINMRLIAEPGFQPGRVLHVEVQISAIDSNIPGSLQFSAYDASGNRITVSVYYTPMAMTVAGTQLLFSGTSPDTIIEHSIQVTNTAKVSQLLSNIRVVGPLAEFTVVGPIVADTVLAPGQSVDVTVRFSGNLTKSYQGALVMDGACSRLSVLLLTHGIYNFSADPIEFGEIIVHDNPIFQSKVKNLSDDSLVIDSIWTSSSVFFHDPTVYGDSLPTVVAIGGSREFGFRYVPTKLGDDTATAYFRSPVGLVRTARLHGRGRYLDGVHQGRPTPNFAIAATPNPVRRASTVQLTLSIHSNPSVDFRASIYSVIGNEIVHRGGHTDANGEASVTFDTHGVPAGIYIYRVESEGQVRSGRVAVE